MRKLFLTTLFLLTCFMAATAQDSQEWKLVWSDEFEGDGPYNAEVWEPERGFVRNHEDQWYQGENAFRENGRLVIECRKTDLPNPMFRKAESGENNVENGQQNRIRRQRSDWRSQRERIGYTSASLTTRRSFNFLYGRLEVRARIPVAGGSWPAIWLLGAPGEDRLSWPSCGEIDVMEYYRVQGVPHILANAAWGNDQNRAVWNSKRIPFTHFTDRDSKWAEKFHIWRMDWTPEAIRIYLDDELLNNIPLSSTVNGEAGRHINPFTRPQYVLLNLALGGDNGGTIDDEAMPMRYEIDYVRVYQNPSIPGSTFVNTPNRRNNRQWRVSTVPRDSIQLSDPCILADYATRTYYMTGTGGLLWKSKDLDNWTGPYRVAETDPDSWMGPRPQIWAAELHQFKGKYYYFATFTNNAIKIDTVRGNVIPRRASHVLVSDRAEGPYRPMQDSIYLNPKQPTLDGTFWVEPDGTPYMVYCGEWLQNWNGTMECIQLKPDLSGTVGEPTVLFRAKDAPWSHEVEDGVEGPNKVTDGPYLFRTGTGRLGMIWTSWVDKDYTQGVAYSQSGTIFGPWVHEPEPITPPNFGHAMLFKTFEGRWLMSVHSHDSSSGHYVRVPHLFEVDLKGDKLRVGKMIE